VWRNVAATLEKLIRNLKQKQKQNVLHPPQAVTRPKPKLRVRRRGKKECREKRKEKNTTTSLLKRPQQGTKTKP
jgi:hypothetical protein